VIFYSNFSIPFSFRFDFVCIVCLRFAFDFQRFRFKAETSEKSDFFVLQSQKGFALFSHRFASTENEQRTLIITDKSGG
jgi:predicted DCC family thiol-disulfide oxidoreductase YuxK